MFAEAITQYHDLISSGKLADYSHQRLMELQEKRGLNFGARPVCTVLRPRFLTIDQYRLLQRSVASLLPALEKIYQRGLVDRQFREQFRLLDWENNLLEIDPGYPSPSPLSRLDAFYVSDNELKYTEFNTETPAGAGYSDALADLFYALPVFQKFQKRYQTIPIPNRPGVYHALLESFYRWDGNQNRVPSLAILDWREVPTFSEFILFYDYFREMGVEVRNVDPRDVEYTNGQLHAGDFPITLIYKRVLISELVERGGLDHPVIQAARDHAVCMVNSFRCKILFKKAAFAVLTDERNRELFSAEELEAISRYIPWTRVVEERHTEWQGQKQDLIPLILKHPEQFVLKPNDDYGGKGITLGWTVSPEIWQQKVLEALQAPFVVQEKVTLPREDYPSFDEGQLRIIPRMLDTNPFVAFGQYVHGCLTRISTEELLNVTAGGGSTVPTFLLDSRP